MRNTLGKIARQLCLSAAFGLAYLPICASGANAAAPDPTVAHADYSDPALWLCRPDLKINYCRVNLDATVIPANGKTHVELFQLANDPAFDCFFVYPTVSKDPGWESDFVPDRMEIEDIREQFARFGSVCRQYAPMYRQYSLTALRRNAGGPQPIGAKPAPGVGGYTDVLDAWNWYMTHENHGRGVVIIGHSQGAAMIKRLIAEQIDGKPEQVRLISALVIGAPVMVPPGKDVGGTFRSIRLCRSEHQTGCVISYSTFRRRDPPPANSKFGRARDGMRVACTNPANLAGGPGEPVSYFLTKGSLNGAGGPAQTQWLTPPRDITTYFVETPGLITTKCVTMGDFDYLQLHVNKDNEEPRTDDIKGEIVRATGVDPSWGLHIIDVDHSLGSLIAIVREQGRTYNKLKAN